MIRDITIGQYYPSNSCIHHLDVRTKIIASLLWIVGLFCIGSWWGYAFAALCLAVVIFLSHVPFKFIVKGLKGIVFILVFTAVLNMFFTSSGDILFQWKFIKITNVGLRTAIMTVIRLVLLIIGTSLLMFTTSPIELTDGIESLLKPLTVIKVPAHEIAMMMSIALRFIPILLEETDKIMKAQMARGADFESGNLIQRVKAYIPILVPLFLSAFRRAEELAMAMEARCYRGGVGRTRMNKLTYKMQDYISFVIMFAFVGVCIWL